MDVRSKRKGEEKKERKGTEKDKKRKKEKKRVGEVTRKADKRQLKIKPR